MDALKQFISHLAPMLWLAPFLILALLAKSPRVKGWFGEWLVKFALRVRLDQTQYRALHDVTFPTEDGSTQIDHVLVSRYGLFVIETKFMKGWIYGSAHQKQWTQKIFKQTYKFQNPLHQNYKHHKTLETALGIDPQTVFSVVVFTGDSTFKTEVPENVTHAGGVIRYIQSKKDLLLSDEEVNRIYQAIESGRLTQNRQTHQAHVAHVKEVIAQKTGAPTCPKCGSDMIKRKVRKGEKAGQLFWGCSEFPTCRGTREIST